MVFKEFKHTVTNKSQKVCEFWNYNLKYAPIFLSQFSVFTVFLANTVGYK